MGDKELLVGDDEDDTPQTVHEENVRLPLISDTNHNKEERDFTSSLQIKKQNSNSNCSSSGKAKPGGSSRYRVPRSGSSISKGQALELTSPSKRSKSDARDQGKWVNAPEMAPHPITGQRVLVTDLINEEKQSKVKQRMEKLLVSVDDDPDFTKRVASLLQNTHSISIQIPYQPT